MMLLFYIGRLRFIWSSFVAWRFSRHGWAQVGRLSVDFGGGRGVAWAYRGRVHHWPPR
jgi:hypothetical protein